MPLNWMVFEVLIWYALLEDEVRMTIDEIKGGENDRIEFKRGLSKDDTRWLKTVVAFANGRGGRILFGVDTDLTVVGMGDDLFGAKNAIADASPITIALYDDRLEVTSPGGLVKGMTLEKMKNGYSECRNKALAAAFAYMNLIENWGSGVKRYIREVKAAGLREPEFIEWPNAIRVNVYRAKVDVDKAGKGESKGKSKGDSCVRNSEAVIKKLSENPALTIPELAKAVHLYVSGIEKIVRGLKRSGRLRRSGATKNGRWIVERCHDHLPLQPRHRHLRRLLDSAVGEEVSPVARVVVWLMTGMTRVYVGYLSVTRTI